MLKQKLAARVQIDPADLPYNEKFLAWLREEKNAGRKLVLATASDLKMAQPIADHVGIFDEVLASNGKTNLRSGNKLRALTEKFGERGFDYAGNSVRRFRRLARLPRSRRRQRQPRRPARGGEIAPNSAPMFCDDYFALETAQSFVNELFWRSGYLVAIFAGLLLASAFPKTQLRRFRLGRAGVDAVCRAWQIRRGRFSRRLRRRTRFLAGVALLAAADSVTHFSHPRLARAGGLSRVLFRRVGLAALPISNFETSSWSGRVLLGARRRGGVGRAGNVPRPAVRRISLELARRVPIPTRSAHPDRLGHRRLWRLLSRRLVFARALLRRPNDFPQPRPPPHLAGGNRPALPRDHLCFVGGFFSMSQGGPAEDFLRVTLIQPSIPQTVIWNPDADENRFAEISRAKRARPHEPHRCARLAGIRRARNERGKLRRHQRPRADPSRLAHSQWRRHDHFADRHELLQRRVPRQPAGRLTAAYHKQKLVIFGEYVPLVRWLPFLKWFTPSAAAGPPAIKP